MRMPSISALKALDGLARHGSMLRAARELNVTPSAISHQLRTLEQELGSSVIERSGKGVNLTPFGKQYADEIRRALTIIRNAGESAASKVPSGRLTVSCVPGFALFWLSSNLKSFSNQFPEIELTIKTPPRLSAVSDLSADLFIAFGTGNWPNMKSELLAEIEFSPYCSPQFLHAHGGKISPKDCQHLPLLHMGNHEDWTRWLAAAGHSFNCARGIVFSDMYLVLSAATSGLGIAIGDNLTCRAAVRDGKLVKPFAKSIRSINSYFLVSDPQVAERDPARVFRFWLQRQLEDLRSELQSPV